MKQTVNQRKLGEAKEDLAITFLKQKGCEILDRNFYIRGGEIDIIGKENGCIFFIEVKYRKSELYGGAVSAISPQKQRRIAKTALHYIAKKGIPMDYPFRFDVILINNNKLTWLKNAFEFPADPGFLL